MSMPAGLRDGDWRRRYAPGIPGAGDPLRDFYIPALARSVRYDRITGYFEAASLAAAARGVEGLVRAGGRMRLVAGIFLKEEDLEAIRRGDSLRGAAEAALLRHPFQAGSQEEADGLELLAWMAANGHLEVRLALPCDEARRPLPGGIFHAKIGVMQDAWGDRLSFCGSNNETAAGWTRNWEDFHVFASWSGDSAHLEEDAATFRDLWEDRDPAAITLEMDAAVRAGLERFLPKDGGMPRMLREDPLPWGADPPQADTAASAKTPESAERPESAKTPESTESADPPVPPDPPDPLLAAENPREEVIRMLRAAAADPSGGLGAATAAVTPWPHQILAFRRMRRGGAPNLLIADEVGLGKTVQAGLILRQGLLEGSVRRALILAPRAVLLQWRRELREKFNIAAPLWDGTFLHWPEGPAHGGRKEPVPQHGGADAWPDAPVLLVSDALARRGRHAALLLAKDGPTWDLVILDEAHHARRSGGFRPGAPRRPNLLLRLMEGLRRRTRGLILLTATPMQVHPVEVFDLLALLGLPPEWTEPDFLNFFALADLPSQDRAQRLEMRRLFRACERDFGAMTEEDAARILPGAGALRRRKVLRALHDAAETPLAGLDRAEFALAVRLMRAWSPSRRLVSRHTRELLRAWRRAGRIGASVPERTVDDVFITLSGEERALHDQVEDFISAAYARAPEEERSAAGFVLTVYRRRLSSSFHALACTLERRLEALRARESGLPAPASLPDAPADAFLEEDRPDADDFPDDPEEEGESGEEAGRRAAWHEEIPELEALLARARALPRLDTKAGRVLEIIRGLRRDGRRQVIVFTQFTDSLDLLREALSADPDSGPILCFSGRGGERRSGAGWKPVSREEVKLAFLRGEADILLCTDAAAEGLNLQTCGALINYDMPWNPMRVEQRIGRIDRLGQKFERIRIVNILYEDTVEADVHRALRARIGLFGAFVGRLQPILARLPEEIRRAALRGGRAEVAERIRREAGAAAPDLEGNDAEAFEARPEPPSSPCGLAWLEGVLRRPHLLPPGFSARPLAGGRDFEYVIPGRKEAIRVTTDAALYAEHPESLELWSPGSPAFPFMSLPADPPAADPPAADAAPDGAPDAGMRTPS